MERKYSAFEMRTRIEKKSDDDFVKVEAKTPAPALKIVPALRTGRGAVSRRATRRKMTRKLISQGLDGVPPQLVTASVFDQVLRFAATTNVSAQAITTAQLAMACGGIATATTTIFPWASCLRIRQIRMYPSAATVGTISSSARLTWSSAFSQFQREDTKDSSLPSGITVPKTLMYRPPRNTLVGDWINSTANGSATLFNVTCLEGTIIDVHVLCMMSNSFASFASVSTTGKTVGDSYWGPLDGYASALLVPIGRSS